MSCLSDKAEEMLTMQQFLQNWQSAATTTAGFF
jgi:hypothetical protein